MTSEVDVDSEAVTSLLRSALAASGLTQNAFARALGTSASRFSTYLTGATRPSGHFCMRARRLGQSLHAARLDGLMSAPDTAEAVRREFAGGQQTWAWRMLLQGRDHLRLMLGNQDHRLLGAWEAAPGSAGSEQFDVLLAALTRHEFAAAGVVPPRWTSVEPLTEPWVIEHPFLDRERTIAMTPEWLRTVNVFVPERDLVTA